MTLLSTNTAISEMLALATTKKLSYKTVFNSKNAKCSRSYVKSFFC